MPALASPEDNSGKLIEFLAQEKINITIANHDLKQAMPPVDQHSLTIKNQQLETMISLVNSKIANFGSFLSDQKKQARRLADELQSLQQSPLEKANELGVQEKISQISNLIEVNDKAIELLNENIRLANQYLINLVEQKDDLKILQAKFDEERDIEQIQNRITVLKEAKESLYQKNIELQRSRKVETTFASNLTYETQLLYNNQLIVLIQYKISALDLKKKIIKADFASLKNDDLKTLQQVTGIYKSVLNQLNNIENGLQEMLGLVKSQKKSLPTNIFNMQFANLEKTIDKRLQETKLETAQIKENLEGKQELLKKQLAQRQSLTEYQLENWSFILLKIIKIPVQFYNYAKTLIIQIKDNYLWQDTWPKIIYWSILGMIFSFFLGLNRLLKWIAKDKERYLLSAHLYDGFLVLLNRNIPLLTLLTSLWVSFYLTHVPFSYAQLLVNLLLVWLSFRSLIIISRLMLLERLSDVSGEDVKFYYRLKWLFLLGGWSTALMVFSHQLPLSTLLQDIFNRLFMIFLLSVSFVTWRSREVIPYLLAPYLSSKRKYLHTAIKILNILIPLTLFSTAIIGLIGYFNLAWSLSLYQIYFLLVITGYVLARGLIFDALELLSVWMISSLQNGWLWIEVILKPLDNIFRLLLFVGGISILFQLFGWYADSWVVAKIIEVGKYPFINISGVHITLFSAAEFILIIFFFSWLAKWTREFSYRWLYRKSKDPGVRNSLSVFTQYAVILLGGFISLRILGLDFSGMSMVLGGLAVGMGFGLRDFASNIVGGLMLLIERPVREGDLITLGSYEGKVSHIGIRSMRVSSWDNTEVLIPNAETFTKPFTNWTHQDSIVRTVVPIKVSRKDDPAMVQQLILDVIVDITEILSDPPPQVLLTKIDDALIEFEIRYFINVELYTRFEIRSKLLFAILAQFSAAGIRSPIPPISVELKEGETRPYVISKQSTEKQS